MFRKLLSGVLVLSFLFLFFPSIQINAEPPTSLSIKPYTDVSRMNLSSMNFRHQQELLSTLTFNNQTIWPSSDKLPEGFDPARILEYGKESCLGIKKLHEMGYTGKGVSVAYIDQPLLLNHIEYKDANVRYYAIRPETPGMKTSMHGPSVLSILAGRETGVAPDSKVYFFGHPAFLRDQTTHAEALRKLIEVNQSLPGEDRIRIVGFSDTADKSEKNVEEFKKAVKEAENSGIMVFLVDTFEAAGLTVKPYKDKNDPNNYDVVNWANNAMLTSNHLFVPCSGITTAGPSSNEYIYWTSGGLSWTIPYIVGTIALGLQIDPTLTKENAIKYLKQSAYPFRIGGIINPKGFLELVSRNCKATNSLTVGPDYTYVLYNSNSVDSADLAAIKSYCGGFTGKQMILKDVSEYTNAGQIYKALKADSLQRSGNLKGIQIIGADHDVPAFDIRFQIQMKDSIDNGGFFQSDFFYSSFKNEDSVLQNDFSIYKNFKENLNVSFSAEWPVMRLPLAKGKIAGFIKKYDSYAESIKNLDAIPLVNFSNPIFASKAHSDDMGMFIRERLDKEFGILDGSQYRLYGNQQGLYPVETDVLGDFTKPNIKLENQKGIVDYFINSHGQENNIDQVVFEKAEKGAVAERRISFLNSKDINQVLSGSYYTLTTWTCLNAFGLGSGNLLHEALANGKCVNAIGATSTLSNNGVNVKASLEAMKKNNFYYFQYIFFKNLTNGFTRSESFYLAQKAYASEILKNTDKLGEGNYQFNLHNLLSNHNLGLFENWSGKHRGLVYMNEKNGKAGSKSGKAGSSSYTEIDFNSEQRDTSVKVNRLSYKISGDVVEFMMDVDCETVKRYVYFNPPEGSIVRSDGSNPVNKGNSVLQFSIPVEKMKLIDELTINIIGENSNNFFFFHTDQLGL